MIISHQHRFVFFHNPKVGGTSVRATIEHLHDDPEVFWGTDKATPEVQLDRAHLGIDEFAQHYPELWDRVQGYAMFCLYRDPLGRFFSSLAEYSKLHGAVDTRFAGAAARKSTLMAMIEKLQGYGQAEAVMDHYDLRHFRPQWIYWNSENADALEMTALPVTRIDALFEAIAARSGQPLTPATRNRGDQLELPGALAPLAASRSVKALANRLPGIGAVKSALRGRFTSKAKPSDRFDLSPEETREVQAFVDRFYARDLALWPAASGA